MPLKRRGAIALLSVLAALIVVMVWRFLQEQPALLGGIESASSSLELARDDASSPAINRRSTEQAETLPPATTPLASLWGTLQARAQSGERGAACRLAIETLRCTYLSSFAEPFRRPSAVPSDQLAALLLIETDTGFFSAPPPTSDRDRRALDDLSAGILKSQGSCEGLLPEWQAMAPELLRAAALAGEPDAQSVYASGEGWFLFSPGALVSPTYDQWVKEAPLLVAQMLDAGHPEAPGLLAGAYSGRTWLAGLYPPNTELAAAYLLLNTRLMQKPDLAESQLRELLPATRASANARAETLYQRHYAGRETPRAGFWIGSGMRQIFDATDKPDATKSLCSASISP